MNPIVSPSLNDSGSALATVAQRIVRTVTAPLIGPPVGEEASVLVAHRSIIAKRGTNPLVSPFDPGPGIGGRFVIPSTIAFG